MGQDLDKFADFWESSLTKHTEYIKLFEERWELLGGL